MDTQKIIAETHQNAWNAQNSTLQVNAPANSKTPQSNAQTVETSTQQTTEGVWSTKNYNNNSKPNYETDIWRKTPSQQEQVN